MKKIFPILMLALIFTLNSCSSNDNGGSGPAPVPKVTANTTVSAPTLSSPDEAVWDSVSTTTLDISGQNVPKRAVPKPATISSTVIVQAINKNDSLYLRLQWNDNDFSVWRDYYSVYSVEPLNFTWNSWSGEDQLYVMFDGAPGGGWDVWNWRVLTTGTDNLAEGFRYRNDSLIRDTGTVPVAIPNNPLPGGRNPYYVHDSLSAFHGYILPLNSLDTNYATSTGWTVGQKVPGWIIDPSLKTASVTRRNSRLDIKAVSNYNTELKKYTVVLARALNTTYDDDLDMSTKNSVTAKIGIFNNQDDFYLGGSNRGFTVNFTLILK
ncbi:MAG: hypothetical protein GXO93_05655 [FCB group bacterium]|nr:hypothetical protein [FCB group bacterium]